MDKNKRRDNACFAFSWARVIVCLMWAVLLLVLYFTLPLILNWQAMVSENVLALNFHMIDVGQGDCIVVELPDDKILMIDTGKEEYYSDVKSYLNKLNINEIDYFVNSHPDTDHSGGLEKLLNDFKIINLYGSDYLSAGSAYNEMVFPPDSINGSNYKITFVSPDEGLVTGNVANDYSLMMTIEYEDTVFVLTGDAPVKMEQVFMDNTSLFDNLENKKVVLKVAHHGSNASSSQEFLDFIFNNVDSKDRFALISSGDNSYGHPNDELLARLESKCGDNIFITNELGDIWATVTPAEMVISNQKCWTNYLIIFIIVVILLLFLSFYNYKAFRPKTENLKNK